MSISTASFDAISDAFHRASGIRLTEAKRHLVVGRLQKLARERGMNNLDDYVAELLRSRDQGEFTRVVDKLTTNETYFFREPAHFDFVAARLEAGELPLGQGRGRLLRAWSAASSSGEEAYSLAMLLAEHLGLEGWQIVGTDLSTAMVRTAQRGLYPLDRASHLSPERLRRWCLRGDGDYAGQLLIKRELRANTSFEGANLMEPLPELGRFDLVFLRNVLIYFDPPAKAHIVSQVSELIEPGGWLFTGHAESLQAPRGLRLVQPAVYQRVG